MTDQISLQQALELVEFQKYSDGKWHVRIVKGNCGTVKGDCGTVEGGCYIVKGNCGTVKGTVYQTINGREWQYVETPKEKLQRLIEEDASKEELLEAFNQLEDN